MAFNASLLGQTEKALNAILERLLDGTGISEPQWVALTLTVLSEGTLSADALAARVAGALKVPPDVAADRLAQLGAGGFVETTAEGLVVASAHGRAQWASVREATGRVVGELWGDVAAADLETAGRVLETVLGRANAYLAAA